MSNDKRRQRHEALVVAAAYTELLSRYVSEVIKLPPLEAHPDCCFVEDTAVVCDNRIVVLQPGHRTRRGEAASVGATLQLCGNVYRMPPFDVGHADGGDLLDTGSELFVGLSSRTNAEAVTDLRRLLSGVRRVIPVDMQAVAASLAHDVSKPPPAFVLHLKSMMTMAAPDIMIVADHPLALACWTSMQSSLERPMRTLVVPDLEAANCLRLPGVLVRRAASEFPRSAALIDSLGIPTAELDMSELAKADGALTCCSLIGKSKDMEFC